MLAARRKSYLNGGEEMNDKDLDAAWARAEELKNIPLAFMSKDQFFIAILNSAFFQLQKLAQDLRAKLAESKKDAGQAHHHWNRARNDLTALESRLAEKDKVIAGLKRAGEAMFPAVQGLDDAKRMWSKARKALAAYEANG